MGGSWLTLIYDGHIIRRLVTGLAGKSGWAGTIGAR